MKRVSTIFMRDILFWLKHIKTLINAWIFFHKLLQLFDFYATHLSHN